MSYNKATIKRSKFGVVFLSKFGNLNGLVDKQKKKKCGKIACLISE